MVLPDIHGSRGGIPGYRASEFRNARSMNFSAPRIAGPTARMRRKTPVADQKTIAASRSSSPHQGARAGESGGLLRRRRRDAAARAARAIISVKRRKPNGQRSESAQPRYAVRASPTG